MPSTQWIEPVTDWEQSDAISDEDFNRIEGNIAHLKAIHDNLDTDVDTHITNTTIHRTAESIRTDSATPLRIECRTSDPAAPQVGQIWMRTDL